MRLLSAAKLLAAVVLTAAFAGHASAQFDHLKCYRIKDTLPKAKYSADLLPANVPPFAAEPGCEIKVPAKLLCINVEKTIVAPPPASPFPPAPDAGDVFCYALRCSNDSTIPKGGLPLDAEDQFGHRQVFVQKHPRLLCAPANLGAATPTPTVTPSPTISPTPTPGPIGSCVDGMGACVCPRPPTATPRPTCTAMCPQTPVPTPSPPPCGQIFNPPFCSASTCPVEQTCVVAGAVCACAECCPCP